MRQLLPGPLLENPDLAKLYEYPPGRWLRANMVSSVDGAASLDGASAGLSSDADRHVFALLRTLADVIVVGASTARTERYAPVRRHELWHSLREGRPPTPPIAVVSARLDLDPASRLIASAPPHARTILITTASAPPERRAELAERADVIVAGQETVDLTAAVRALADRGHRRLLAEGGPHLLSQLIADGLLDELCLTIGPLLAGPAASRIVAGAASPAHPLPLTLAHVLEDNGFLLCRYTRESHLPERTVVPAGASSWVATHAMTGVLTHDEDGGTPLACLPDARRYPGLGKVPVTICSGTQETAMPLHTQVDGDAQDEQFGINPVYVRELGFEVPRYRLPQHGMLPDTALQVVRDELILDGNARLNLATFVTTWMEPQAERLMAECAPKNMIDKDEYPQTAELERRCVNILSTLWNAPAGNQATGCSTTGSSEACMLGGMALLWRWRAQRKAAGLDATKPNLVMGSNAQVCWDKFCRYWQVEPRRVPMVPERLHLGAAEAVAKCDENTIGVVAILGSTMDGSYEPVLEISQALDRLQTDQGHDVPVHVDAASGGFVAPFLQQDLEWDFRVPRVASINASGHKYGLVYPGVGWAMWRTPDALPEDLIFRVNYLGGQMPTFALNFSRPGAQVAAQYYNFIRLGFRGYRQVHQTCQDVALHLSGKIAKMGPFELLTEGRDLPVFAFRLRDDITGYSVFDLSDRLRQRGWQVPAYTFPEDMKDTAVMRIVVRNGFSMDLADVLLEDLKKHVRSLEHHPQTQPPPEIQRMRQAFRH